MSDRGNRDDVGGEARDLDPAAGGRTAGEFCRSSDQCQAYDALEAQRRRDACDIAARLSVMPTASRLKKARQQVAEGRIGVGEVARLEEEMERVRQLRRAFVQNELEVGGVSVGLASEDGRVQEGLVDGGPAYVVMSTARADRCWAVGDRVREALYGEVVLARRVTPVRALPGDGRPRFASTREAFVVKRLFLDWICQQGREPGAPMQEDPLVEVAAMLALACPGHPALSPLSACIKDSLNLYLIMPYCGTELFTQLTDRTLNPTGRFSEPVARAMFWDVMSALEYSHARGIAHRDISLENTVVDPATGHATVIDLGLAGFFRPFVAPGQRSVGPECPPGTLRPTGKLSYLAPEIVQGHPTTPVGVDLWAAAAVLYLLLTGSPLVKIANRSDKRYTELRTVGLRRRMMAEHWHTVLSDDCIDLLDRMLVPKPASDRLYLADVFAHPWMQEEARRRRTAAAGAGAGTGAGTGAASGTGGRQ